RKVPLAQGILQADWVSTVSPTYAREIQTPDFGSGLEALLGARSAHLSGILNGIDPQVWDPGSDQALERRYGLSNLPERNANKAALQSELGLKPNPRIPMLGMVARFDPQKGLDLVWPALEGLSSSGWQFVLLGTGDPALEQLSQAYAEKMSGQVRVVLQFASSLARRIYAGSDMLLVPSRYEPCGLTQMIAMRYGCVPIVRATGGLLDTVIDLDPSGEGTGFVFQDASIEALQSAIGRALDVYVQPERWARLQQSGMRQDFSWTRSAGEYMKLYQTIRQRHAD
ncbi:MAG: glycosyltransferase, partial [Anaerolineales bacterium]